MTPLFPAHGTELTEDAHQQAQEAEMSSPNNEPQSLRDAIERRTEELRVSSKVCCPVCGSDRNVTYGGRAGGTDSMDIWQCSAHSEFKTPVS